MARWRLAAWSLVLCICAVESVSAQELNASQIDLIKRTAGDVCNTVREARGQKTDTQIEGAVNAKLAVLPGKLVDLGAAGKGSLSKEEFEGLTRDATAAALQGDRECRERVFNKMFDRLSEASSRSTSSSVGTAQNGAGYEKQFKLDGGQTTLLTDSHVTFAVVGTPSGGRSDLIGVVLDGKRAQLSVGSAIQLPQEAGACKVVLLALVKERRGGDFLLKCS